MCLSYEQPHQKSAHDDHHNEDDDHHNDQEPLDVHWAAGELGQLAQKTWEAAAEPAAAAATGRAAAARTAAAAVGTAATAGAAVAVRQGAAVTAGAAGAAAEEIWTQAMVVLWKGDIRGQRVISWSGGTGSVDSGVDPSTQLRKVYSCIKIFIPNLSFWLKSKFGVRGFLENGWIHPSFKILYK